MKYRAFRKCTKNFNELFTKEKKTKELQIELDETTIRITEHQYGMPISEPYIDIANKDGITYSMDLSTFIKKITT